VAPVVGCLLGGNAILLIIIVTAAVLLAIIAVLWGTYLLWERIRQGSSRNILAESEYSFAGYLLPVFVSVVLSAIIGTATSIATMAGISNVGSPGWWLVGWLARWIDRSHYVGLLVVSGFVLNSALCLAVLWGGFLLWRRHQRRRSADGSKDEIQRLF
jgi:ABC-type uncharacterized transport system permease subunit